MKQVFGMVAVLVIAGCGGSSENPDPALPARPALQWTPQAIRSFTFSWSNVSTATADNAAATEYRLLEDPDSHSGYTTIATLAASTTSHTLASVPLVQRVNARYILQACNAAGCTDSKPLSIEGNLAAAVGYFKASNTGYSDFFGDSVALSADGSTLVVGASNENSSATGVNGDQTDSSGINTGAAYVFIRSGGAWSQQAYLKASNAGQGDAFGSSVALSADGNTLAVSAIGERSAATGVNGDQTDDSLVFEGGAVYVFVRTAGTWSQQAYVKASNTETQDRFGTSLALAADGQTLAVGADGEASGATNINGDQSSNSAGSSGAVYVFARSASSWAQQAYVKASNTGTSDLFGSSVALSADGSTLAVGAPGEWSAARGVYSDQTDNSARSSGAVHVFTRAGSNWAHQAYLKASNAERGDQFGASVALSSTGDTLAAGADGEDSGATGVGGNSSSNSDDGSGAAYVFARTGGQWAEQAYLKASNTDAGDALGAQIALAANGNLLVVGAGGEGSRASGINGDQGDDSAPGGGAAYVFARDGSAWKQQAYIKASNTEAHDYLGSSVALSADGSTVAAGARNEASHATGISGNQTDNSAESSGAVYLY